MQKELKLTDIRIDGGTQQRPVDDDVVARYRALMEDGVEFPPVDLFFDGTAYWLWDGFHRYHAYLKMKKESVAVSVEKGTQREAIWLSFQANKLHGFPRQPGTAKGIIERILADPEWVKNSQVAIARWVGTTHQYVSKIKAELPAHPATGCRIEPDSKPKKPLMRSEKLKVKRGEQEYEMKNADTEHSEVFDTAGKKVPENLVEVFRRTGEIKQYIRQLNDMLRAIKQAVEDEDPLWAYCKIQPLEMEIKNVKRNLRFTIPYAVCSYCAGKNSEDCRFCEGNGFINEIGHRQVPEEMKE